MDSSTVSTATKPLTRHHDLDVRGRYKTWRRNRSLNDLDAEPEPGNLSKADTFHSTRVQDIKDTARARWQRTRSIIQPKGKDGSKAIDTRSSDSRNDLTPVAHSLPTFEPDPYDVRDIPTYSTSRAILKRHHTLSIGSAIPTERSTKRHRIPSIVAPKTPTETNHLKLQPQKSLMSMLEARSRLLESLSEDILLCIADHLWYPDVFAFALTCKAIHRLGLVNGRRKLAYTQTITTDGSKVKDKRYPLFCGVCLYLLDSSYFHLSKSALLLTPEERKAGVVICQQCCELREGRVGWKDEEGIEEEDKATISPVWRYAYSCFLPSLSYISTDIYRGRPSERVIIPDTSEFLWYRERP